MSAHRRIGLLTAAALAATVALHVAGSGLLGAPPLGSWADLDAWYARTGPSVGTVALVRLLAFGAGCWLVAAGGLQLVAAFVTSTRFSAVVDTVSPRFLRALAGSAAGLSVTAGLAVPVVPSGAAGNPPGTAVMIPLDAPAPSTTTTVPRSTTSTTAPTTSTTASTTSTTVTATTATIGAPVTAPSPTGTVAPPVHHPEVVVGRGDSFWSIAVEEAGDREVVGYWRALIDANRDRLIDRSNPDLLYPGQILRLP